MFGKLFTLRLAFIFFIYILLVGHSPWGQYHAYRQQHLLIMSTREDIPTYPFSKKLVKVINQELAFTETEGNLQYNPWYYELQHLSFNYRLTEIQAAIAREQLKKLVQLI